MFTICKDASRDTEDYRRVLELATEAGEADPESRSWWNLRGYAQYRLGQYAEALLALERAAELRASSGSSPVSMNHVFQAMTLHKLGRFEKAREVLLESERLTRTNPATESEWQLVAAEAASLLGISLETHSASSQGKE